MFIYYDKLDIKKIQPLQVYNIRYNNIVTT